MAKLSKEIADFMEAHGVLADEVWEVRPGTFAIKHKALERLAVEKEIDFDTPEILAIDLKEKMVAVAVTGSRVVDGKKRLEWSTGEAAPYNNKNGYPVAMAEKRARDRVVLKLLTIHGALYSEAEADEFTEKRQNPHVTRPADVMEPIEYDEQGHPIDNIPLGDPTIEVLSKAKAKPDWSKAQSEIQSLTTVRALENWGATNANRVASFPPEWQEFLRGVYRDHLADVRSKLKQEAA